MTIDKSNKYDRQLRLWASTGQSNLELSHICLINGTTTGSEILKNLILPGIGNFTIIDDKEITTNDLAGNFFLTNDNIGQLRASALCESLMELNEDSKGHAITDSLDEIDDSVWDRFNVVVVSDYIDPEFLDTLKTKLFKKEIPLFIVNTVGFYGTINLIINEITVIETHTSQLFDLRIDQPWQELSELSDSYQLDSLDDSDHAHVPYVIILMQALRSWSDSHNGPPTTMTEKRQFKKFVQDQSRNFTFETNFNEAVSSVFRAYQKTQVPSMVKLLMNNDKISDKNLNNETPFFWILIRALKSFVELYGNLPLPGTLPDMASDTNNYITLQNLYRDKAAKDKELFIEEVKRVLTIIGRLDGLTALEIELINIFCKNSHSIHVTSGSSQMTSKSLLEQMLSNKSNDYDNEEYNHLAIYFGIMTFNHFIKQNNHVPEESDYDNFIKLFSEVFECHPDLPLSALKTFKEIVCHSSSHYHNISSLMGGIASQEVLKIATSQYVPLDNLYVFDGIRSQSDKYKI